MGNPYKTPAFISPKIILKAIVYGLIASGILLGVYFAILSLVSGWAFAKDQFSLFWYFIISLAIGFGIQIGLNVYFRNLIKSGHGSGRVLGVTGTTSTAAMISCCAHYLANILPVLGATGILALVGQYQIEFFWIGLASNALGVAYLLKKIIRYSKHA